MATFAGRPIRGFDAGGKPGDRLTCLEFARIFGLRLKRGTLAEEAAVLAALIQRTGAGWEAIYDDPAPRWPPLGRQALLPESRTDHMCRILDSR